MLQCPADVRKNDIQTLSTGTGTVQSKLSYSYYSGDLWEVGDITVKLSAYRYPSRSLNACDGNGLGATYMNPFGQWYGQPYLSFRHGDGINILYIDGHARWEGPPFTKLLDEKNPLWKVGYNGKPWGT